MTGTDLEWSRDSRYLYANRAGQQASIFRIGTRIGAGDGKEEMVVDFHKLDTLNLTDNGHDLLFSLAPDGSIILHRHMQAGEIYEYDLKD